nr:hypothetical protein [Tanacetum cinerariifolium]
MSLSLTRNVIIAGDDNRPPMLDKSNYISWASHMLLYIKGKLNGKLLVDCVLNGPFQFGTVLEPGIESTTVTVRARTYTDLTDEEKLCESVDITATNIVLQAPSAKEVLMANLSSCDSDVLSKESKQKEDKYLDEIINLQKKKKALDNVAYKIDKKYFGIKKNESSLDNDRLLELIICQDVMNVVMHANDHHDNMLLANNNSLVHDNSTLDRLKHKNDRLMELLISQDLVHIAVNSLATINDYKSMEQSYVDKYEENFEISD